MSPQEFIQQYHAEACEAGMKYKLNPVVLLAHAAIESGWATSVLARIHKNLFGMTAYGTPNEYWHGCRVKISQSSRLSFRKYGETRLSFLDHARMLRENYPGAVALSFHPEAYAREIAYSRYLSDERGDNRERYRTAISLLCKKIGGMKS